LSSFEAQEILAFVSSDLINIGRTLFACHGRRNDSFSFCARSRGVFPRSALSSSGMNSFMPNSSGGRLLADLQYSIMGKRFSPKEHVPKMLIQGSFVDFHH
jgi:hypothetical protein